MKTLNRKKKTDKAVGSNETKRASKFDAVGMMRDIRARISAETNTMSYDQLMNYISEKLNRKKIKNTKIRL